jgi:hypothetical protein
MSSVIAHGLAVIIHVTLVVIWALRLENDVVFDVGQDDRVTTWMTVFLQIGATVCQYDIFRVSSLRLIMIP